MYDAILQGDINLAVTTDILDEYVWERWLGGGVGFMTGLR